MMRRFRVLVAGVLALTLGLAVASVALAKGDRVVATLDAPLPVNATPGTTVPIAWTLSITFDDGSVHPFLAEGVFIRLSTPAGALVEVPARSDRDGHFVATVTVPEGGIGTVAIGLQGAVCRANAGCTRSDELFRIEPQPHRAAGAAIGAQAPRVQPTAAVAAPAVETVVAPVAATAANADTPAAVAMDVAAILGVAALAILLLVLGLSVRGRWRPAAT